jgi:hypothetical protein
VGHQRTFSRSQAHAEEAAEVAKPVEETRQQKETEEAARPVMSRMEQSFGTSFSDVSLRTDPEAAQRADSMGARAWAEGNEIGFGKGQFSPKTEEGQLTIAHELAHVVQSRGGSGGEAGAGVALGGGEPGVHGRRKSRPGHGKRVEAEAERAAHSAVKGKPSSVSLKVGGRHGRDDKQPAPDDDLPPPGSYRILEGQEGSYSFVFNTTDTNKWQEPLFIAVRYYMTTAFPGVSDAVIRECMRSTQPYWADGKTFEKLAENLRFQVEILPELHKSTVKLMEEHYLSV